MVDGVDTADIVDTVDTYKFVDTLKGTEITAHPPENLKAFQENFFDVAPHVSQMLCSTVGGANPTPVPTPEPPVPTPMPTPAPTFALYPGGVFALKGGRGKKYCADDDEEKVLGRVKRVEGKVLCNRNKVDTWEKFSVEDAGDGKIALRGGRGGKYCADDVEGVVCNRNTLGDWEKFSVEDAGDGTIALKGGRSGKYCADEKDKNAVVCDRNTLSNEKDMFSISKH